VKWAPALLLGILDLAGVVFTGSGVRADLFGQPVAVRATMTDHFAVSRKHVTRYYVVIGRRTYELTETAYRRTERPGCMSSRT